MSKPPGPITRSLLALTDALARSFHSATPGDPERSVVELGDDLTAEFPLDQGHAGEFVRHRDGHALVVGIKVLAVVGCRRQRHRITTAPARNPSHPERGR